ncbi:MAG: hypothetical protein KDD35_02570 [Bdellovibrionales bacterium]|nr:hypothetical protein [Bdellovibrionales bacterium]
MQAKNDLKFLGELAAMGIEYIRLPNLAEGDVSSELEVEIKHWLISPKNIFVLDFESSITITQPILVKLTQFRNSLVKAGKEVYRVNSG